MSFLFGDDPPPDNSAALAETEEAKKGVLRRKIAALFGDAPTKISPDDLGPITAPGINWDASDPAGDMTGNINQQVSERQRRAEQELSELTPLAAAARSQFGAEDTEISGALRGFQSDDLKKRYEDAERKIRFGAANTGNIGSTTFADALSGISEENQRGGASIEESVRRAIGGLRASREDVRGRSIGLVNAGFGEEGVRSATEGLRSAADTARSANREQLFNDFFNNLAFTNTLSNNASRNSAAQSFLQNRGSGSSFQSRPSQGRIY